MTNTVDSVAKIRLGVDSQFDAWLYSMLMDNNLDYNLNPHLVASHEQLAFIVHLEENQIYLPCSDKTFFLLDNKSNPDLRRQYNRAWRIVVRLIRQSIDDATLRRRLLKFCSYRYRQYTSHQTLLPSRLVKRMTDLFLKHAFNPHEDPWGTRKHLAVQKHVDLINSPEIKEALDHIDPAILSQSMADIRQKLNQLEMIRLFCCTLMARVWEDNPPSHSEVTKVLGEAESMAQEMLTALDKGGQKQLTILYLCDADGSPFFDLMAIKALMRMGHRVIYAVKDGFFFYAPTINDLTNDPILEDLAKSGKIIPEKNLSKNELLKELHAHKLLIINDGTRERLNLYRVSTTFARAWKEADLILARGWRASDILLGTSHEFTRDIICFWHDTQGFHLTRRPHAKQAKKFSEEDLRAHADKIIKTMRDAHKEQRTVIFYSCIIGSIPGQTKMAITLANTLVNDLRQRLDSVLVINPAEHFIEGMDGDDLMYIWERVQRSGQIDIWRFQTTQDIELSFSLLGKKIPPIWSGKDATYSTGCTKEMQIALDVQKKNREMQIIGPDPKLFVRRGEYGVGQYFDAEISAKKYKR
ncbi:MAG: hypothetical protein IJT59_05405 [Desulfovibrionaceae bacterium]|nr:hypothetical protein [Desulfovibrionaceae bacterium]